MVPELENATVTELQVRMDCNGCVQKIKRVMHKIEGVYDVCIDFSQQKLTVVGRADPEMLVKAIKKISGKIATICPQQEPSTPSEEQPPAPEAPAPDGSNPSPALDAASEPPCEAPQEPTPAVEPSPDAKEAEDPDDKLDTKDVGMVHYYPYGYIHWNHYALGGHEGRYDPSPYFVTHNYNSYRPASHAYEHGHIRYIGTEAYGSIDGYHHSFNAGNNNNITSVFSDENPNACNIV